MSREIQQDFESLCAFLKDYRLENIIDEKGFKENLSKAHKKYFALLTLISELRNFADDSSFHPELTQTQYLYFVESSSDIGSAVFHAVSGSYKSARMLLRSSIETFFKAFSSDDIKDVYLEKRVFYMFEQIKKLSYFQKEPQKSLFESSHTEYGNLCRDIHTADTKNMQMLTALKYFPSYDETKMIELADMVVKLVSTFIFLLCNKYNTHYQNMHHRNKEIILTGIKRNYRPLIIANLELE